MLDTILKLIDKATDLVRQGQRNHEKMFSEVIDPLFNELPFVVQDYFIIFQEVENLSGDNEIAMRDARKVIKMLANRRKQFLHARIRIRAMAKLLWEESDDPLIIEFAESVLKFFHSSTIPRHVLFHTDYYDRKQDTDTIVFIDLFKAFESRSQKEIQSANLYAATLTMQKKLESSWADITKAFASLRLGYTKTTVGRKLRKEARIRIERERQFREEAEARKLDFALFLADLKKWRQMRENKIRALQESENTRRCGK